MANPNIVNVSSIYGNTGYVIPSSANTNTTSWTYNGTTTLTGLTPATNTVNKIDQIIAANLSSSAVTCQVAIGNNTTFASATVVTYLAYNITVPPNASVIVSDKTSAFYITENQSVAVQSSSANNLTFMVSFEAIS